MDPNDLAFTAATPTRYLTVPLLTWSSLILLCYWTAVRMGARDRIVMAMAIGCALILAFGNYKLRSWRAENEVPFADAQVTAMSIDTGLTDSELIARIFPSPEFIEIFMPPIQKDHLALFSHRHEEWLGKPLYEFGTVSDKQAAGQISYVAPVEGGLEVVGWVNSTDVRDPFPRVLLVNEKGQIIGWGRQPTASFPPDWLSLTTPKHEAWVGFANLKVPSRSVKAYALNRRNIAEIPGTATIPTIQAATRYQVGAPLKNITWQIDQTWAPNGIPVLPRFGWIPTTAPFSSWQGGDAKTGQITAEFAKPGNGCVSVGILHGPSSEGLSAEFVDADNGRSLGTVPFRDHDYLWSLWKIRPGSEVTRIRFVATDQGVNWGQWLAISDPLECH
jgi:hypothetical protein